jgi:DNA replication protein DnaC
MLRDGGSFFDETFAHRAPYDAKYTYLLYKKLLSIENSLKIAKDISPFSSSKVDNPFQKYFDDMELYENEFANLLSIVDEIKQDENSQSKTALVIGEAGNGKTHLMMRFLKGVSDTNRFLFVGKPNNKDSILCHMYTKILESFIQKIDDSIYSQLEYLYGKIIFFYHYRVIKEQ